MDLTKLTGWELYKLIGTPHGKSAEAELDRRNVIAGRRTAKNRRNRKPTYRMADYDYEMGWERLDREMARERESR